MHTQDEIMEKARYCYLVFRQLGWLYSNINIDPSEYIKHIQESSLQLFRDSFIMTTLEDGEENGNIEDTLRRLVAFYEGIVFALSDVLKIDFNVLEQEVSSDVLERIAQEVGMKYIL